MLMLLQLWGSCAGWLTDLVESDNVTALDVLVHRLSTQMVLNESVNRDKVIDNGQHDLQLLDAISNWDKLGCKGKQMYTSETKLINGQTCEFHYNLGVAKPRGNIHAPQSSPSILTLLTASSSLAMSVSSSHGFTSSKTDDFPANKVQKGKNHAFKFFWVWTTKHSLNNNIEVARVSF